MACFQFYKSDLQRYAKELSLSQHSVEYYLGRYQLINDPDNNTLPTIEQLREFVIHYTKYSKQVTEALAPKEEVDTKVFNVSSNVRVPVQDALSQTYTPRILKYRIDSLFNAFIDLLNTNIQEEINRLTELWEKADNPIEKAQLRGKIKNLSDPNQQYLYYLSNIKGGVTVLLKQLKSQFSVYLQTSEEDRKAIEIGDEDTSNWTQEDWDNFNKNLNYQYTEIKKMLDDNIFPLLCDKMLAQLKNIYDIKVDLSNNTVTKEDFIEESTEADKSIIDGLNQLEKEETAVKDGWQVNDWKISSFSRLSGTVRKIISRIPAIDSEGNYVVDDLGNMIYLKPHNVHAQLIYYLHNIRKSSEIIPRLQSLVKTYPYFSSLIEKCQKDPQFLTLLYSDIRKIYIHFAMQFLDLNADGIQKTKTVNLNNPENLQYLIGEWQSYYTEGTPLSKISIYNKNGTLNKENAKKIEEAFKKLQADLKGKTKEEREEIIISDAFLNRLYTGLQCLGISVPLNILKNTILQNDKILQNYNTIYSKCYKIAELVQKQQEDIPINPFVEYNTLYEALAKLFNVVTPDAQESSIYEKGNRYYAYQNPSYFHTLIDKIANAKDDEELVAFLKEEYLKYSWFSREGLCLNPYITFLLNNPKARKELKTKILLHYNGKEVKYWTEKDRALVLFGEYFGSPNEEYTYYQVPFLANTDNPLFIRMPRYTDKSIDDNGNSTSVLDYITDKFVNIAIQEINRILLVQKRAAALKAGTANFSAIENYDITYDKDGNIKNIGGAEFKFLTFLNGTDILEKVKKHQVNLNSITAIELLKTTIKAKLQEAVTEEIQRYKRLDVYEIVVKQGKNKQKETKFKYFPEIDTAQDHYKSIISYVAECLNLYSSILGKDTQDPRLEPLYALQRSLNSAEFMTRDEIISIIKKAQKQLDSILPSSTPDKYKSTGSFIDDLVKKSEMEKSMEEFVLNTMLATCNIIELTSTDLAYYPNLTTFQKRQKQQLGAGIKLDTEATWNGERVGREKERCIYLQDSKIKSKLADELESTIKERVVKKEITAYDACNLLASYGLSNEEIGNTPYYTLTDLATNKKVFVKTSKVNVTDGQSYRTISSYRRVMIMCGRWSERLETAYNNIKNGKFDMEDYNIIFQTIKPFTYTQVEQEDGVGGKLKVPVQHKTSEFILLALNDFVAAGLSSSEKLRAINEFMEENDIDVVTFNSSVKVGVSAALDLSQVSSKQDVKNALTKHLSVPEAVHEVSYEDWCIQTETPEHYVDKTQFFGTQIRKLIFADMPNDFSTTIHGHTLNKEQWINLYQTIIVENIKESKVDLDEIFNDPKKLEKVLHDTIKSSSRYPEDLIKCFTLDETGKFPIDWSDPTIQNQVQEILLSLIRNRVLSQKIKGGSAIQVSSYGLSTDLQIVYEGKGDNKHIKYIECYLPAYSKDFFEAYIDPNTGQLDINSVPEELRKIIGYRIPTESYYSMAPLYIKGFLPQQNGSAIMLPKEITTIAGSDFDVDKLFLMIPEYQVLRYNREKAKKEYEASGKFVNAIMSEVASDSEQSFEEWFKENKERFRYSTPKLIKVKYDYSKSPSEQSRAARNNALIELCWSRLTSPDVLTKLLNPGGFANLKKTSKCCEILTLVKSKKELTKLLKEHHISLDSISELFELDYSVIEDIHTKLQSSQNPLLPSTQLSYQIQNATGSQLIGIYAVINSLLSIMQLSDMYLNDTVFGFTLDGKRGGKLNSMFSFSGEYISRNLAGFVGASVDNPKELVLYGMNQNSLTAPITNYLICCGFDYPVIGLLLNQPIIKKVFEIAQQEHISVTEAAASIAPLKTRRSTKQAIDIKSLSEHLLTDRKEETFESVYSTTPYEDSLLTLLDKIAAGAKVLQSFTMTMRMDSTHAAPHKSVSTIFAMLQNIEDYNKNSKPLIEHGNIPILDKKKSLSPFMSMFVQAGFDTKILKKYIPLIDHYKTLYKKLHLYFPTLSEKEINNIFKEFSAYKIAPVTGSKDVEISRQFIMNFPNVYWEQFSKDEILHYNTFLRSLRIEKINGISVLTLKNNTNLVKQDKDELTAAWEELLYSEKKEHRDLAINLFRYCIACNGGLFGVYNFGYLAPLSVKLATPGYKNKLKSRKTNLTDQNYYEYFVQYIMNHTNKRALIKNIPRQCSLTKYFKGYPDSVEIPSEEVTKSNMPGLANAVVIKFSNFGENVYYMRYNDNDFGKKDSEDIPHTFIKINKLGIPNAILEYAQDIDFTDIKTQIIPPSASLEIKVIQDADSADSQTEDPIDTPPPIVPIPVQKKQSKQLTGNALFNSNVDVDNLLEEVSIDDFPSDDDHTDDTGNVICRL